MDSHGESLASMNSNKLISQESHANVKYIQNSPKQTRAWRDLRKLWEESLIISHNPSEDPSSINGPRILRASQNTPNTVNHCVLFGFREMKKSSGCNQCTHPSCGYGLNANGVASCSECDDGVLVLDLTSAPKWQLACNQYRLFIICYPLPATLSSLVITRYSSFLNLSHITIASLITITLPIDTWYYLLIPSDTHCYLIILNYT